ncbi:MAG TPA: hypothetical protein VD947_03660 [Patescibacteria group bacterium]|nr:hypothetical protein [Patescibacteria group bacterium]
MKKNSKGFSAIRFLIVISAAGVLAFTSFYISQRHKPVPKEENTNQDAGALEDRLPSHLYKEFRCNRTTKEALSTDKYCNNYDLYKRDHAAGII